MCGVLPNVCDVAQAAPEVVIMHVGGKLLVEVLCCPGSCLQLLSSTMRRDVCGCSVCVHMLVVVSVPRCELMPSLRFQVLLREGHGALGRNEVYALEFVRVGMRCCSSSLAVSPYLL